jgi:hypothetical protein
MTILSRAAQVDTPGCPFGEDLLPKVVGHPVNFGRMEP